ncbi:hypothetical protein DCAR_0100435 [Daucus carota subsp. sativus]|uniref:Uncharacterized protein n=1 Tax=Daucus carota subsp. sativus TaxID=79200 RepID=A0AAF0W0U2_DAUCS|nr:hypothetical protein DCAR_0100435 [Daucus carota subsp. sativus]
MHRSSSSNRVSEHLYPQLPASASSPSLTLRQSSSELFTDELPTLHPKSYVAMRQKARLQIADSAIHIIPFILIFSVLVLWFFSKPGVSIKIRNPDYPIFRSGIRFKISGNLDIRSE